MLHRAGVFPIEPYSVLAMLLGAGKTHAPRDFTRRPSWVVEGAARRVASHCCVVLFEMTIPRLIPIRCRVED